MPDPRVSILQRDGDQSAFYSSYADARTASTDGDVIIVWGDLNEPINLKNKVDIWLMPGVVVNNSSTTILAPTSGELNCKIYGQGIIKTNSNGNCIYINNDIANISIECDLIEGTGGSGSAVSVNIQKANEFRLTCNKVSNRDNQAIRIGELFNQGLIQNLYLNILYVETGNNSTPHTGTTAITTRGNGYIFINEILCRNLGHCLSHREGEITANIKKLTTKMNRANAIAAVHLDQGTGTQKLILYFDEILNFNGSFNSGIGIHLHEGTGIFIGRKVFSENEEAINMFDNTTKGYFNCKELISLIKSAIKIDSNNEQILIKSEYIEGFGFTGSLYLQNDANLLLKNAKIINTDNTSNSKCIVLEKPDTLLPNLTLNNVKAVTGNTSTGTIIFQAGFTGISIKNYGFFANKSLDTGISLVIGDTSNFIFIVSTDLT